MKSSNSNNSEATISWFKSLLVWICLALFLRWQVIEPRWIPSGSMLPTLKVQERLLVEKVSPKINFVFKKRPQRNSIVVFNPPESLIEAGYEKDQALIKRIVGITGDKIEIENGKLIRNDSVVNEPWLNEDIKYVMNPIIVPKDSLWVLGDNRNNSLDSHYWGALPERNVVGTAIFRYWPLKRISIIRFPATKELNR